jgi:hypothetical protein
MLVHALSDPAPVLSLRGEHGRGTVRRSGAEEGNLLAYWCSLFGKGDPAQGVYGL